MNMFQCWCYPFPRLRWYNSGSRPWQYRLDLSLPKRIIRMGIQTRTKYYQGTLSQTCYQYLWGFVFHLLGTPNPSYQGHCSRYPPHPLIQKLISDPSGKPSFQQICMKKMYKKSNLPPINIFFTSYEVEYIILLPHRQSSINRLQ